MCAQYLARTLRRDVESVLHGSGGVVGQEVQRVEVEVLGLHLRALGDLPAHRDEHVGDLLGDDGDRVPGADRRTASGERHVDGLGDQHCGVALGEQRGTARLESLGHPAARDVHSLSGVGLRRFRQTTQRALRQGQRRPAAEMLGFRDRERIQIAGSGKRLLGGRRCRGQCLLGQRRVLLACVDVVGHDAPSLPWGSVRGHS